jgi:hypothetical protein
LENFFTIIVALCPPNPKVLLTAVDISLFCEELRVRFSLLSISGSG